MKTYSKKVVEEEEEERKKERKKKEERRGEGTGRGGFSYPFILCFSILVTSFFLIFGHLTFFINIMKLVSNRGKRKFAKVDLFLWQFM